MLYSEMKRIFMLYAFVDSFIMIKFLHLMLPYRRKDVMYASIAFMAIRIHYMLESLIQSNVVIFSIMVILLYIVCNTKGTWKKKCYSFLLSYGIFFVICFTCLMLEGFLSSSLTFNHLRNYTNAVFQMTIASIVYALLYCYFKKSQFLLHLEFQDLIPFSLGSIAYMGMIYTIYELDVVTKIPSSYTFRMSLFGMLVYALFLYYVNTQIRQRKMILDKDTKLSIIKENEVLQDHLKLTYENNRKLHHDVQNHLNVLSYMIQDQQYDDTKQYLHTLTDQFKEDHQIYLNRPVLYYIINSKMQWMKEEHIHFMIQADSMMEQIDDYSLTLLLGNLLDNAIEAQAYVKTQKIIRLRLGELGSQSYLKIENTYSPDHIKEGINGYSSQKEGDHGIGLKNVKEWAKNHNAEVKITRTNTMFTTILLFE